MKRKSRDKKYSEFYNSICCIVTKSMITPYGSIVEKFPRTNCKRDDIIKRFYNQTEQMEYVNILFTAWFEQVFIKRLSVDYQLGYFIDKHFKSIKKLF